MFNGKEDKTEFLMNHLGGASLKSILFEKGWTNDEIDSEIRALVEAEKPLIDFMNSDGRDNYGALPLAWRGPMLVLTAVRYLVDTAGVDFMSIKERMFWEGEGYQVNEMRLDRPRNITKKRKEESKKEGPVTYG